MWRVVTPKALLTRCSSPSRSPAWRSDSREKPRRSQNSTETSVSRGASTISGSSTASVSSTTGEKNWLKRGLPPLQEPHLPERTEHGRHQLGELHVLAQIGRIGGRRQAAPLGVEPSGHVESPAAARLAQHRRAKGPIEGVACRVRLAAGLLRAAPHVQHALPLPQRFEYQPSAGPKIAADGQPLVPVQNKRRGERGERRGGSVRFLRPCSLLFRFLLSRLLCASLCSLRLFARLLPPPPPPPHPPAARRPATCSPAARKAPDRRRPPRSRRAAGSRPRCGGRDCETAPP